MAQKIVHGIDEIVDQIKNQKFLLVRDRAYNYLKRKTLFDAIPHVEFSEFTPNPLYEQV